MDYTKERKRKNRGRESEGRYDEQDFTIKEEGSE